MSSRSPLPVVLSPDAQDDFEDIALRGLSIWGMQQSRAYAETLLRGIERIGRFPNLGRRADHLAPGVRAHVVREHVVLYRVLEDSVLVSRILHRRQDPTSQMTR